MKGLLVPRGAAPTTNVLILGSLAGGPELVLRKERCAGLDVPLQSAAADLWCGRDVGAVAAWRRLRQRPLPLRGLPHRPNLQLWIMPSWLVYLRRVRVGTMYVWLLRRGALLLW